MTGYDHFSEVEREPIGEDFVFSKPEPFEEPPELEPIASGERIELIDSMRGFAVLGILLVNMTVFSMPAFRLAGYEMPNNTVYDVMVEYGIHFFAQHKFFIIFSFMFGLGVAVQLERCLATERAFFGFFLKRMSVLLLIGTLHGFLVWSGDVLVMYSLIGILLGPLLYLMRRRSPWILVIAALLALSWYAHSQWQPYIQLLEREAQPDGMENALRQAEQQRLAINSFVEEGLWIYRQGDYEAMNTQRHMEFMWSLRSVGYWVPMLLVTSLLGAFCWRIGLFHEPEKFRGFLRKYFLWGGAIGIFCSAATVVLFKNHAFGSDRLLSSLLDLPGQFGLGYAYLAGLCLLYISGRASVLFKALAPVGRMALTNYLMHSVVFTFIFYNHGLGLIGTMGDATTIWLTLGMFAFQIVLSKWWLARFRFGPMEWVWRSATYLKPQPMLRELDPSASDFPH